MNKQFRACIREMFYYDINTDVWTGRWDVAGVNASGERRQFQVDGPVANPYHPAAEQEKAVAELWSKVRAAGVVPSIGVLKLPRGNSRYLA